MPLLVAIRDKLPAAFLAAGILCAFVIGYVLAVGAGGTQEIRVLASLGTIGAGSVLVLSAVPAACGRRWHPLGLLAMGSVVLAMVLVLFAIWTCSTDSEPSPRLELYGAITLSACILAIALTHVALLSLARLLSHHMWVLGATIGAIAVLAVCFGVVAVGRPGEPDETHLFILMGLFGMLDLWGTLAVAALHRVAAGKSGEHSPTRDRQLGQQPDAPAPPALPAHVWPAIRVFGITHAAGAASIPIALLAMGFGVDASPLKILSMLATWVLVTTVLDAASFACGLFRITRSGLFLQRRVFRSAVLCAIVVVPIAALAVPSVFWLQGVLGSDSLRGWPMLAGMCSIPGVAAFAMGSFARHFCYRAQGLCLRCNYNLTGNVSGRCPECGTDIAHFAKGASHAHGT